MNIFSSNVRKYLLVFAFAASLFLTAFQDPQQTGGISIWVWILAILVLLLLIFLWLRSSRQAPSTPERMERDLTPTPVIPDDLTIIEGIGPKIAQILQDAGITTFSQLAAASPDRLNEILEQSGIRLADPESWSEQASLAAAGDQAGLAALQDRLKGGRRV